MRTPSPVQRATLRIALAPVLAAGSLTAAAAPASAEVIGTGSLEIFVMPGGFNVCVDGAVPASPRVVGQWILTITGARTAGDYAEIINPEPWTSTGWTADHCEPVWWFSFPSGWVHAEFSYGGVGTYVIVHSTGGGIWTPDSPPVTYAVDNTP